MNQNAREIDCQQILELIPAYAIGATDAAETALVEEHLARCPTAQAELAQYLAMVEDVLRPTVLVSPPVALERNILAAATILPAPPMRYYWGVRLAAAAILLTLVGLLALLATYANQQATEADEARAALHRAETEQAILLGLSGSENRVQLAATSEGNDFAASLTWHADEALLRVAALPLLSRDQTYQLWLIDDDTILSVGLFSVNETGDSITLLDLPAPIDQFRQVGISIEPRGGSQAPTTTPILLGDIAG